MIENVELNLWICFAHSEIRRLMHYRLQQQEIEDLMRQEREATNFPEDVTASRPDISLPMVSAKPGLNRQLSRNNSKLDVRREKSKLKREKTNGALRRERSQHRNDVTNNRGKPGSRGSVALSRGNSRSDMTNQQNRLNPYKVQTANVHLNVLVNKLYYLQMSLGHMEVEEQRLQVRTAIPVDIWRSYNVGLVLGQPSRCISHPSKNRPTFPTTMGI